MTIYRCDRCYKDVLKLVTVTVQTRLGGKLVTPRTMEVCEACEPLALGEIEIATTWVKPVEAPVEPAL